MLHSLHRNEPMYLASILVVLTAAAVLAAAPAGAARSRQTHPPLKLAVPPSPETDARVEREVARAQAVLDRMDIAAIFDSPYLASAVYYHDGFLDDYPDERPDGNPARRIIARVSRQLTPERKARYIELLHRACAPPAAAGARRYVVPVRYAEPRGHRNPHRYALDLFAAEGSPVYSAASAVVVLAESNWTRGDPFSTSTERGGNSVIVFNPETGRFFRYCHLAAAEVRAGQAVEAGGRIGTVGHTGADASRRGHGRHLHFEVNQYDGTRVRPLTAAELRTLVRGWLARGD